MFISHTPINLPVSTANLAVESLTKEASLKPQIPEAPPTNQSSSSKHSTDFSEQNKPNLLNSLIQDKTVKEQTEQNDSNSEESTKNQKEENGTEDGNNKIKTAESDLDRSDLQLVAELQARDREVRTHEAAHASVGGSLAGSPNLSYTSGPDGKRYATSGEVSIDISKVANDPSATITKLQQVQRAALAPPQPSSQDRKVAANASAGINDAQVEVRLENLENLNKSKKNSQPQDRLDAVGQSINPVKALRESRALEQKFEDYGALNNQSPANQLSQIV